MPSEPPRDLSLIRHVVADARTIVRKRVARGACLNGPWRGAGAELGGFGSRRAVNNEKFATTSSLPKQIFSHGIMDEGGRTEERTK